MTGNAFRKIFTSLVLFWTIAACEEKKKVFLIEEPESQLYPELFIQFIDLLKKKMQVNGKFNSLSLQIVIMYLTFFSGKVKYFQNNFVFDNNN